MLFWATGEARSLTTTRAGVVSGVPPETLNVPSVLFIVDCLYVSSMCVLVAEDVSYI